MLAGQRAAIAADDAETKRLYFCTVYLSPGDYHGVHAPVDMALDGRRHFPGLALPVAPFIVGLLQGLFAQVTCVLRLR